MAFLPVFLLLLLVASQLVSHTVECSQLYRTSLAPLSLSTRQQQQQQLHTIKLHDTRRQRVAPWLRIRGGSIESDDDEDEYEEEDVDSDDDLLGMDDFEVGEDDFAESNMVEEVMDAWQKTPPFTKMYLSASFAVSLMAYVTNKNQFPSILSLKWKPTIQRMQLWRLLTPFLNFGPFGLVWVLTAQFVWNYMSTLERMHHDRPYDFWIMVLFGCINMVTGYGLLKIPPKFLGHNLSTFFVYVWSRYHEGMEVSVFDLFTTRAELLPWIFLAQTFLLEGEPPLLDMLGIVFGHIYHHCKTVGMLRAPDALVNWYNGDSSVTAYIREKYKEIAADFEMQ